MKKSKLLIPALSVASVGAVVAPMVTSCAQTSTLSFDTAKNSAWETYKNKFESLKDLKFKSQIELANSYANAVNGNSDIFADDVIGSYLLMMKDETAPKSETISVSNAKITNQWKTYDSSLEESITTSIINWNLEVKRVVTEDDEDLEYVLSYDLVNMPYTMYFSNTSLSVTTPLLIPVFYAVTRGMSSTQAVLAFLAAKPVANFHMIIREAANVENVYTDLTVSLDAITLLSMMNMSEDASVLLQYLALPLQLPVVSNYYKNATESKN